MSDFNAALIDYRYLKERGYPHRAVLKIIGDHYRLTRTARNCLFRGVVGKQAAEATSEKRVSASDLLHQVLGIDWFNVIITVESYLKGLTLFIAEDGIMRDSSGVHGSYRFTEISERALDDIMLVLESFDLERIEVYLDGPVSHSGDMATKLRDTARQMISSRFVVMVVPSADYPLKNFNGIVASSDSIILEHSMKVFDLAQYVLGLRYGYLPPVLDRLVV